MTVPFYDLFGFTALFGLYADDIACVGYELTRADFGALAAVDTLIVVDMSEETVNMDSVVFTCPYAH